MSLTRLAFKEVGWRMRAVEGYGKMTCAQFIVLREMCKCKADGWNFVDLDAIDQRIVEALERRHYIFASNGKDGVKYSVTRRGEMAYKVFSVPPEEYRSDGICPRCNVRPRGKRKSGARRSYCLTCDREIARKNRELNVYKSRPGVCPRCQQNPKAKTHNGRVREYCRQCLNESAREYRQKQRKS